MTLEYLAKEAAACKLCVLGETRQLTVFGEGHPRAQIMLIGEAPGAKEDETGRPFVGSAGQILDEILQGAGILREDVFITSVIKCRPPKNRFPKRAEVAACQTYLQKQIELIKPRIIVCMGSLALRTLIDPRLKITEAHGRWYEKDGIKLMPIYHPAAILYDRKKLEMIKQDFYQIKQMVDTF